MPPIVSELFSQLLPYLVGSGGFIFWILGKKERKATTEVTEASALQEMQKAYAQYVQDNDKVIAELKKDFEGMKIKLRTYIDQCVECPNNKLTK